MGMLDDVVLFAVKAHKGMKRKGDNQPYIYHPLEVMTIASSITQDEDVLAACMLHDVLEDTDTTYEDIVNVSNKRVAELVLSETEDKRGNKNKESTWLSRKVESLNKIKNHEDVGAQIVCMSDKLANLRSFNRLKLLKGEHAWDAFNQKDPCMHYWYFEEFRKVFEPNFKETGVYVEYCFLVSALFEDCIKKEK